MKRKTSGNKKETKFLLNLIWTWELGTLQPNLKLIILVVWEIEFTEGSVGTSRLRINNFAT